MGSIAKRPVRLPIRSRGKVLRHMMVKRQAISLLPAGTTSEKRRRQVREYRLRRELSNLKMSIRRRRKFQSRRPIHGIFSSFGHLNPSSKHRIGCTYDRWMKSWAKTAISLFERESVRVRVGNRDMKEKKEKKACKVFKEVYLYIRNI